MISAAWKNRRRHRPLRAAPQRRPSPLPKLAQNWKRALDDLASAIQSSQELCVNFLLRAATEALLSLQAGMGHGNLLLASISNSATEQTAFLPSKNRPVNGGGSNNASQGDGGKDQGKKDDPEQRILISEVDIVGVDGELKDLARNALTIKPNYTYYSSEVQDDARRIFDTGYFHYVDWDTEDTRDGVKLTLQVSANPTLRSLWTVGANVLPQSVVQDAFQCQYGKALNYNQMGAGVKKLNDWYERNGVFGQVTDVYYKDEGSVEVRVAEAVINKLQLKYLDKKTGEAREEGKTRPDVILRTLTLKPGQVYNMYRAKKDIESVYQLGMFDDVSIRPVTAPGSSIADPHVDLELEVKERKTRGLSAGGGISQAGALEGGMPGFVGRLALKDGNLLGTGQKLVAEVDVGQSGSGPQAETTFRISHFDPWVRGDAYHTSRTSSIDYSKASTAVIHGPAPDDDQAAAPPRGRGALGLGAVGGGGGADEGVFVERTVGKLEWGRPLGNGWHGNLGVSWQQGRCVDSHGQPLLQDHYGGQLAFSPGGRDTLALGLLRLAYNSPQGSSHALATVEQSVPVRQDYLNFNRLTVRAERALPLGPASIWLCGKGGAIMGDLPPYEAFPIGGTNSVRGYAEGAVGTGRRHVTGTAELRVPLIRPLEGTLFVDGEQVDLDSGATVPGDPAGRRQKPGRGYGVGAGVRLDTPLGPLRLEYAWNDRKQRRFHLGIGNG